MQQDTITRGLGSHPTSVTDSIPVGIGDAHKGKSCLHLALEKGISSLYDGQLQ